MPKNLFARALVVAAAAVVVSISMGCIILSDEKIVGFGDREVVVTHHYPFPADLYVNEVLVTAMLQAGVEAQYVQDASDTNELRVKLVSSGDPSFILTNLLFRGESRSISSWDMQTAHHEVVVRPPVK
jgi:hypothetical protein